MYGWSFQGHANSRKERIGVNFSANSIAHMLRIIKRDDSKKEHVFHAPDNHSNTEYNVDVISNVMFQNIIFSLIMEIASLNFQDSFLTVHRLNVCK